MPTYEAAVLWCALQATLIAGLGAVATWLLMRRAPGSAAIAAAGAALTVLGMTLLVPVPLPALSLVERDYADSMARSRVASEAKVESEDRAVAGVDLAAIIETVRRTLDGGRVWPEAAQTMEISWASVMLGIGAVVGVMRLGASWRYVSRLRASAGPISDKRLATLFTTLAMKLGVRRVVELAETPLLASPAIVGWRRPAVLLPQVWSAWSDEELRAALAHELAHAARGDFGWRALASVVQALHAINPLVHVLVRRLALAQELAADRLAATVMGGTGVYLRAMSELALRLDDDRRRNSGAFRQRRLRAEPMVLPTFSSFLMRRIAMLRSKDGSMGHGRRSVAGVVAAGLIALTGVATMALRGSAESVGPTASSPAESAALFARQPLDPAILRRPDAGVFIFRFAEMAERPALVPLVELYERCLQEGWEPVLGVKTAPEIHLEEIEYVAGAATMTLKPKTTAQMAQTRFSCEELIVRFKRPVAWKSWTLANVGGAEEVHDKGFEYVALPKSAWLGKLQVFMAARDEQTIVLSANVDRLRELVAGEPAVKPHASAAKWTHLDGGLMAYLSPLKPTGERVPVAEEDQPIDPAALDGDPAAAVTQAICLNVQELGGGFDLAGSTNDSGVRVCLTCADQAKAEQLKKILEARRLQALNFLQAVKFGLVDIARTDEDKAMAPADGGEDAIEQEFRWLFALLGSSRMELEPRDDGRVDIRIEAQAKFPALAIQQYVARVTKEEGVEAK
jgi:Zn-dependent protease with chaperone function